MCPVFAAAAAVAAGATVRNAKLTARPFLSPSEHAVPWHAKGGTHMQCAAAAVAWRVAQMPARSVAEEVAVHPSSRRSSAAACGTSRRGGLAAGPAAGAMASGW